MNLTTARASHRWKEIGVRKSIGAKKGQLFTQFIFESMLLAFMALVLAALLAVVFIPILNQLIGRQLVLLNVMANPWQPVLIVMITLVLGVLTASTLPFT